MVNPPMSHALSTAMSVIPVVAIVRLRAADTALPVAAAVRAGGIRAIEITLTTDGALSAVGAMRNVGLEGLCVGVGSVRTVDDARRAIDAGAEYLVTPILNVDVVTESRRAGVPIVCGGFTPTELEVASRAGADYVKLFPASAVGPRYVREILAPMPDLRIVPTGGVNAENIGDYREAGAVGAGIGSALVDSDTVAAEDWDTLEKRAISLVTAWRE